MTATERKPSDAATYADIQSLQDQMDRFEARIDARLDRMEARFDVLLSELRELRVDVRQHVQSPAAHVGARP